MERWKFVNLSVQNVNYTGLKRPQNVSMSCDVKGDARSKLANVLFKRSLAFGSAISFGWSKNLPEVEKKILDILTDSKNKEVIICSHSYPDGDAYGSNLGIAGILESMGKKAHSIIDFRPKLAFQYLPSPDRSKTATQYIKDLNGLSDIRKADVAVFTDTAEPNMVKSDKRDENNKVLDDIISKNPKSIIIIDHHPDQQGDVSNKDKWFKELNKRGVSNSNILYWREKRASACEMVAEMDREIATESTKRSISGYDPNFYHSYRLATATGIITDANGSQTKKGEIDKTKFARLSYQSDLTTEGKKISKTRQAFEWLINKCDIKKSEIDHSKLISRLELDERITSKVQDIVNGRIKVDGIDVKVPTKNDPLGYIYVHKNWTALEEIAKLDNDPRTNAKFILKMFKIEMSEKLMNDKNAGLYILANTGRDDRAYLTIRSYGFDTLNGELHKEGHVFGNDLAHDVINKLEPIHGEGGGHKNAASFRSNKRVDFYKQILPFIEDTIKEYKKAHPDLTKAPKDKLDFYKSISLSA